MGQKEKAKAVAESHEFAFRTAFNAEEILGVLEAAAAAAAPGGLKGSFRCTSSRRSNEDRFVSEWEFWGPGGLVKVMTFTMTGEPADGETAVRMEIGKYMYQKGSLFSKPTLNGGKQLRKLHQIAVEQLAAQPL